MMIPPKAPLPVFSEVEYNDDNSCIICYDDMMDKNSERLECGHRFHKTVSYYYNYTIMLKIIIIIVRTFYYYYSLLCFFITVYTCLVE